MRYIETLHEGETIRNTYLCKGKRSAETRNGKPYDNLILQDKTGTLDGKIWDPNSNGIADYSEKDFIEVYGEIISYNGNLQMNIKQLRVADEGEYDPADYMPTSEKSVDSMYEELLGFIRGISNTWLRQLLEWHQDMSDSRDFVNTVKMDVFADEVFVFTPRGDVIDLPVGAVPIDFAYRIHTDVGNRCVGAKVNGRIVPLDYKLSNGDIVEVITSKQAAGPSRDWLNIVGSSDSRNKIKSWFKKERREENIIKGREMLEKECKRLGYDTKILLKSDKLKDVSAQLRLENEENLMATIGYGGITLNSVMSKLVELYKKEQKLTTTKDLSQLLAELKPRRSKAKSSHGILVKGEEGIMVKLARCCNPIPGDPVIGYITRGSGISVHRRDCPNVMSNNPEEQNRLIEVAWDIATDSLYKVNIIISAGDRPGMMADIMMVMSESKLNINALNCRIDKHKMANISMGIDISNLEQLDNIMNKIKRMKGVYSVERMISNGQGG